MAAWRKAAGVRMADLLIATDRDGEIALTESLMCRLPVARFVWRALVKALGVVEPHADVRLGSSPLPVVQAPYPSQVPTGSRRIFGKFI